MIQRIQSLHLVFALTLMVLTLFLPYALIIDTNGNIFKLTAEGVLNQEGELLHRTLPLLIIIMAISLLIFITIFLYKKRVLQMRLSIFSILLMLGSVGLMFYYIYQFNQTHPGTISYKISLIFPLMSSILTFLAF